jgi:hypothetical protein
VRDGVSCTVREGERQRSWCFSSAWLGPGWPGRAGPTSSARSRRTTPTSRSTGTPCGEASRLSRCRPSHVAGGQSPRSLRHLQLRPLGCDVGEQPAFPSRSGERRRRTGVLPGPVVPGHPRASRGRHTDPDRREAPSPDRLNPLERPERSRLPVEAAEALERSRVRRASLAPSSQRRRAARSALGDWLVRFVVALTDKCGLVFSSGYVVAVTLSPPSCSPLRRRRVGLWRGTVLVYSRFRPRSDRGGTRGPSSGRLDRSRVAACSGCRKRVGHVPAVSPSCPSYLQPCAGAEQPLWDTCGPVGMLPAIVIRLLARSLGRRGVGGGVAPGTPGITSDGVTTVTPPRRTRSYAAFRPGDQAGDASPAA